MKNPLWMIETRREELDRLIANTQAAGGKLLQSNQEKFLETVTKVEALSPLKVLSRGYAIASSEGKTLYSIKSVCIGEIIKNTLADGEFFSEIVKINETKKKGKKYEENNEV